MYKRIILSALLLLAASVQTVWAQPGMVVIQNDKNLFIPINNVKRVLFVEDISDYEIYEYVDLDLPSGTLWATYNIGAENPEDDGDYFAWGETEPKDNYTWGTYTFCEGSNDNLTKYCTYAAYGYNGFVDNETMLYEEDDAATKERGRQWYIPYIEQFEELIDSEYTTTTWTTVGGKNGWKVTSKSNGNSIFLPAAGYRDGESLSYPGEMGYYWSSDLAGTDYSAKVLLFYSGGIYTGTNDRRYGQCIRPVRVKDPEYVDLDLPSKTLWAACNLGAGSPENVGVYFAWGETIMKFEFYWRNYMHSNNEGDVMTKYNEEDGLTVLLPEDDAATEYWYDKWQTPSPEQMKELINSSYTTIEWTTLNSVNGLKVTSKSNGNSIFLPAGGYRSGTTEYFGTDGCYMSNSRDPYNRSNMLFLMFDSYPDADIYSIGRFHGLLVRPVRKQ